MPSTSQGVVSFHKEEPVQIVEIVVPEPGPYDVIVTVEACGVCHTDLHYRDGNITDSFPFLLGHEAAGKVERIGPSVTEVAVGDFVILNWRASCGSCRSCRRGRPWYCFNTNNASKPMTLSDGTPLASALGIGAFATRTLVHEGQCTKVDPRVPAKAAGLLGCGVMAGIGAALNTGQVRRGDSVAVIGCGGVGDAAIAGAALGGATTIIAIDIDPRKLTWAKDFGATHTINASEIDPVEAVRALSNGNGVDLVIDAVGSAATYQQALSARDLAGTVVLVGVPNPNERVELSLIDLFGQGGSLKSSWYGDCLPSRDFPALVDLYLQGRLPLDSFISEEISLGDVEEAFTKMQRGDVLRSVVLL